MPSFPASKKSNEIESNNTEKKQSENKTAKKQQKKVQKAPTKKTVKKTIIQKVTKQPVTVSSDEIQLVEQVDNMNQKPSESQQVPQVPQVPQVQQVQQVPRQNTLPNDVTDFEKYAAQFNGNRSHFFPFQILDIKQGTFGFYITIQYITISDIDGLRESFGLPIQVVDEYKLYYGTHLIYDISFEDLECQGKIFSFYMEYPIEYNPEYIHILEENVMSVITQRAPSLPFTKEYQLQNKLVIYCRDNKFIFHDNSMMQYYGNYVEKFGSFVYNDGDIMYTAKFKDGHSDLVDEDLIIQMSKGVGNKVDRPDYINYPFPFEKPLDIIIYRITEAYVNDNGTNPNKFYMVIERLSLEELVALEKYGIRIEDKGNKNVYFHDSFAGIISYKVSNDAESLHMSINYYPTHKIPTIDQRSLLDPLANPVEHKVPLTSLMEKINGDIVIRYDQDNDSDIDANSYYLYLLSGNFVQFRFVNNKNLCQILWNGEEILANTELVQEEYSRTQYKYKTISVNPENGSQLPDNLPPELLNMTPEEMQRLISLSEMVIKGNQDTLQTMVTGNSAMASQQLPPQYFQNR
jgi:hypothetical protein